MKKILLMISAFLMAGMAGAQEIDEYKLPGLESMVVRNITSMTGETVTKTVFERDAEGKVVKILNYHMNGEATELFERTEVSYNAAGQIAREDTYTATDGVFGLSARQDYSYDANGHAIEQLSYSLGENASAGIQLEGKTVSGGYVGNIPASMTVYGWDGSSWQQVSSLVQTFNAAGQVAKTTINMHVNQMGMDMEMQSVSVYEYDSHGYPTKITASTEMMGMNVGSSVTTYTNTYNAAGLPEVIKAVSDAMGQTTQVITNYYYGAGGSTGIDAIKRAAAAARFYSLDGKPINGVPTKAGVYILNGNKVTIK